MAVVKFEADRENDLIRIPEQYINQIPNRVSVTLDDVEKPRFRTEMFTEEYYRLAEEAEVEEQQARVTWLKRLDAAINLSLDEELPDVLRSQSIREPLNLID